MHGHKFHKSCAPLDKFLDPLVNAPPFFPVQVETMIISQFSHHYKKKKNSLIKEYSEILFQENKDHCEKIGPYGPELIWHFGT